MNANQTIPVIAKIAPPLLIGVAVFLALKEIFSGEDTEKKSETTPTKSQTENLRKEAEIPIFRVIPAEIPVKPVTVPVPSARVPVVVPPSPVPSALKITSIFSQVSAVPATKTPAPVPIPVIVPIVKTIVQTIPLSVTKKFVTRADLATVFHYGKQPLTRTAAVAALKSLGFGKTAAYAALSPDGRFSAWLHCTPDGIITWKS
jgi:hypothetical protein